MVGAAGIALWATETCLVSFAAGLPTFEIVGLAFAAAALLSLRSGGSRATSNAGLSPTRSLWLVTVSSLVCYHACIYFCLQRVPAAPAALLQGCTPLSIVLGSAFLPGQRLRWWHVVGVVAGLEGLISLSAAGRGLAAFAEGGATVFLALIGLAAGLWGLYSLVSSRFGTVPTSALGVFYAASSLTALACHGIFETWVAPTWPQIAAVAALGVLPMGLALFCWDFGLKKGDLQALGAMSYVEPLIGAGLVVLLGQGQLQWTMVISGLVIVGGAMIGAADFFEKDHPEKARTAPNAERMAEEDCQKHDNGPLNALAPQIQRWITLLAEQQGLSTQAVLRQCAEFTFAEVFDNSEDARNK